ncbi:unnamed protein product, partial [Allacma fusca]
LIEKHETCISELRARLKLGRSNRAHTDGTNSREESFNHENIPSDEEENDIQDHPQALNTLARVTTWVINGPKSSHRHGRTMSQSIMTLYSWATKTIINMNAPTNSSGDYSQWTQYFNSPAEQVPPPNPSWAGPGPQAQETKPEPIPPVPIVSTTSVQNTDRSSPYPTPPTVCFSIPTSPFHPPMNITTSQMPPQQQPQPQHPEPAKNTVLVEPQANNPDGDHEEKETHPTKSEEPPATGGGDH